MTNLEIFFVVAVDMSWENWEKAEILSHTPEPLINFYLDQESLCCCTMKAGFLMTTDGEQWGAFDEFENALWWLDSLDKLLNGEDNIFVFAWEESDMIIKRFDDEIEMSDTHHSGTVIAPTVRVGLKDFVSKMLIAARSWSGLGKEVRRHLNDIKKRTGYSVWLSKKESDQRSKEDYDEGEALDQLDKHETAIKAGQIYPDSIGNPAQSINEKIFLIEERFPISLDQKLNAIEAKLRQIQ